MLLNLIEGSQLHEEVRYLAAMYGLQVHEAIEQAVRLQARLTKKLAGKDEVRLWGGPPYGELHFVE